MGDRLPLILLRQLDQYLILKVFEHDLLVILFLLAQNIHPLNLFLETFLLILVLSDLLFKLLSV